MKFLGVKYECIFIIIGIHVIPVKNSSKIISYFLFNEVVSFSLAIMMDC